MSTPAPQSPAAAEDRSPAAGEAPGPAGAGWTSAAGPGIHRVYGVDLSLTSTGVACIDGGEVRTGRIRVACKGYRRLYEIRDRVCEFAALPGLVVVEGPSFASKGNAVHQLGGLWWFVTAHLWKLGVPLAVVPPASLKRFACGRGNAGKDEVLAAVVRRFPMAEVTGNDAADALVLAAMGADWLGQPLVAMPQAHRAALAKVAWPEVA